MTIVTLGDTVELAYGKSLPVRARRDGSIPVYGSNGMVGFHDEALVREPTVVVGRKGSVGAVQLVSGPSFPIDTTYFVRAKPGIEIDIRYAAYALKHMDLSRLRTETGVPGLNREDAYREPFFLPPLAEQRRIVDILNRTARIETLRARSAERLREFVPALFVKMFGDRNKIRNRFSCRPLHEVATIASGATKGRKIEPADAIDVPYLRVANVQDGFLTLDEIKTITIRRGEEQQYALAPGDLVMTEGGDQDKLGRAAIWNGELAYCAHQNHVFRVRPRADVVLTDYLRDVVGSAHGKAYFLSVAKRTTGIASINKTQLGEFSVPVPSMELQARYTRFVAGARSIAVAADGATARAAAVSASLMYRLLEGPLALGNT